MQKMCAPIILTRATKRVYFSMIQKLWLLILTTKPNRTVTHVDFFAGLLTAWSYTKTAMLTIIIGTVAFLIFYAAIYLLNEIVDLPSDRADCTRARRPLASGKLTVVEVGITAILLFTVGISLTWRVNPGSILLCGILVLINLVYVMYLKKFAYFDILLISMTRPIKVIVAVLLVTSSLGLLELLPLLVFMYGVTLCYQASKKYCRLDQVKTSNERSVSKNVFSLLSLVGLILGIASLCYLSGAVLYLAIPLLFYNLGYVVFLRIPVTNKFVHVVEQKASEI